ncbi:hypothetical protein [Clostridium sp.]|uniref:hypothetical protein n=1 Tax=Clostridium sp. TaxID=1506 RepID=UPI0032176CD1
MNPVAIFIIIILTVLLWFLLSFAFYPLGKFVYRIWKDAVDEINKKDEKETR